MTLAKDNTQLNGLKLYFDCGTEDNYGFDNGARQHRRDAYESRLSARSASLLRPPRLDYAAQHTNESCFPLEAFNGNERSPRYNSLWTFGSRRSNTIERCRPAKHSGFYKIFDVRAS